VFPASYAVLGITIYIKKINTKVTKHSLLWTILAPISAPFGLGVLADKNENNNRQHH